MNSFEELKKEIFEYICDTTCDKCDSRHNCRRKSLIQEVETKLCNIKVFGERLEKCTEHSGTKQHVLAKEYKELFK